ncbi:unnamed protein product [Rodentolepis nana]|uniref:Uncharacterized protein n=1 Tax=Rodentolepis nana TaxID=102285 RepID=A0A3P7RSQ2_RODNA|nr:unnamed protein product [Rodentolepis nana]
MWINFCLPNRTSNLLICELLLFRRLESLQLQQQVL